MKYISYSFFWVNLQLPQTRCDFLVILAHYMMDCFDFFGIMSNRIISTVSFDYFVVFSTQEIKFRFSKNRLGYNSTH